jgi:hypothetical protein
LILYDLKDIVNKGYVRKLGRTSER